MAGMWVKVVKGRWGTLPSKHGFRSLRLYDSAIVGTTRHNSRQGVRSYPPLFLSVCRLLIKIKYAGLPLGEPQATAQWRVKLETGDVPATQLGLGTSHPPLSSPSRQDKGCNKRVSIGLRTPLCAWLASVGIEQTWQLS